LPITLGACSCETTRLETLPAKGEPVSKGLHGRGGGTVLPFLIQETSWEESYGFTANNPMGVGSGLEAGGRNQQRYPNAVLGPRGEVLSYEREGSCCAFKILEGGTDHKGQFDVYSLTWKGREESLKIYLNMNEEGDFKTPRGQPVARQGRPDSLRPGRRRTG